MNVFIECLGTVVKCPSFYKRSLYLFFSCYDTPRGCPSKNLYLAEFCNTRALSSVQKKLIGLIGIFHPLPHIKVQQLWHSEDFV